jgi:hypothetical protein
MRKIAAADAVRKLKEQMAAESAGSGSSQAANSSGLNEQQDGGDDRPSRKMLDGLL